VETGISEMGRGEDPTDGLADGTGADDAEGTGADEAEAPGPEHTPYGDCMQNATKEAMRFCAEGMSHSGT